MRYKWLNKIQQSLKNWDIKTKQNLPLLKMKQATNTYWFKCCYSLNRGRISHCYMRNASNTHSNTHFSTHSLWLVKIHMGPTKSCGSHINLVGPMWILTNQRKCVEKYVLECVLLAFLLLYSMKVNQSYQTLSIKNC